MLIINDFFDICNRETGLRRPRRFGRQFSANQGIVKQIDLYRELKGDCFFVKSLEFNSSGDLLVSATTDKQVIFWNWETITRRLSYDAGHSEHLHQVKIIPLTNDRRVVTAGRGGQVRLGQVLDDGQVHTKKLGSHDRDIYKEIICSLAVEPGNPNIIYSSGSDSLVQHFDLRSNSATNILSCNKIAQIGAPRAVKLQIYQMVFDPTNPNYFCIGGDDVYAHVYDIRKCRQDASKGSLVKPVNTFRPPHLMRTHPPFSITGLAYSYSGELLVSYRDEHIYLFQKDMGLGAPPSSFFETGNMEQVLNKPTQFVGRSALNPLNLSFFGPNDEYVMSGSWCSHIFIWKKNGGEHVRVMKGDTLYVGCIQPHPYDPVIATAGWDHSLKVWAPMANEDASPLPDNIVEIMNWNCQEIIRNNDRKCRL